MQKQWVELIAAHPKHGEVGKKLELDSAVAKSLVEDGFAKNIEAQKSVTADDVAAEIKGYCDNLIKTEVKSGFDQLREEQKQTNLVITKHFGSSVPATAKDKDAEKWFGCKSGREFFSLVKQFSPPEENAPFPANAPEHLLNATKAATGMTTNSGELGGYLCPPEFSNQVMEIAFNDSPLLNNVDRHTFSGSSLVVKAVKDASRATGSRRGAMQAYWLDEAAQFTSSKPKFREITIKPYKLGVFVAATDEQLQDTGYGFSLEQKIAQYAGEELRFMLVDSVFRGDGVGKPLGVLNSPCLVTVAAEGGQTADTINIDNMLKMYTRMLPQSLPFAEWYININAFPQFIKMAWPTAAGSVPAWMPGQYFPNMANAPAGLFLGRPLNIIEHASSIGDLGDITFLDMRHYILGQRGGLNAAFSIHLRFDYAENVWRFYVRVGGQPWLDAAITPYKGVGGGNDTLSPMVALAAR